VRQSGSSKQCLWLGAGRYRISCRDTSANPNRFADSCVKRYSMRADNADTYAKRNSVAYTNRDSYSYADCYDTTIPDAYAERHNPAIADTNGDCLAYGYAKGYTKTSTDSASSAVRKW
jgi:hypothetical protein